jgi:CDP-glucose 4,6-dehydratase
MHIEPAFWTGKRVLLTGHTGFKGSWLSLWLQRMGAELHGLALAPPTEPALFDVARVGTGMASSTIADIRDFDLVHGVFKKAKPEIVIHMAAQPLVRLSYHMPVETYATNVMGTVHVLEAARQVNGVQAVVNITTDKCYENKEWAWAYREDEPMGGYDPYSNSKGCAELVTSAYRRSFMADAAVNLASARAGNVIGGGDWAADRLIPDTLRALQKGEAIRIRNPRSVRPWQHVLEPLSGYLVLAQLLSLDDGRRYAEGWNFGPRQEDAREVQWIVNRMIRKWGSGDLAIESGTPLHEAHYLKLDISKAAASLNWFPRWTLDRALDKIIEWHRAWIRGADMREMCHLQIAEFTNSSAQGTD